MFTCSHEGQRNWADGNLTGRNRPPAQLQDDSSSLRKKQLNVETNTTKKMLVVKLWLQESGYYWHSRKTEKRSLMKSSQDGRKPQLCQEGGAGSWAKVYSQLLFQAAHSAVRLRENPDRRPRTWHDLDRRVWGRKQSRSLSVWHLEELPPHFAAGSDLKLLKCSGKHEQLREGGEAGGSGSGTLLQSPAN